MKAATQLVQNATGIPQSTCTKWFLKRQHYKEFYELQLKLKNKKKRKTYSKKLFLKQKGGLFPKAEATLAAEIKFQLASGKR
jgi:hypothetical protein